MERNALVMLLVAGTLCICLPARAQELCATVYEHDLRGDAKNIYDGEHVYYIGNLWNDQISSMLVQPGCVLNAWEHSYQGRHKSFAGEVPWVGDDWNDLISSYICTC